MTTVRKTIAVSGEQDAWIKGRIASGDYLNDSEYFRDLIRRDQERNVEAPAQFHALKAAIREGMESANSKFTVPQIMKRVERKLKADGKL